MVDDRISNARVSAAALADLLGVTSQTVTDRARRGVVPRDDDGRFPLRDAVRAYADELHAAAGRHGAGKRNPERERLLAGQARLVELKVAQAEGRLLDARAVETEWSDVVRTLRAGMLSLSSRLGARLPALSRAEVEVIDDEIRRLLTGMGDPEPAPPAEPRARHREIMELIG